MGRGEKGGEGEEGEGDEGWRGVEGDGLSSARCVSVGLFLFLLWPLLSVPLLLRVQGDDGEAGGQLQHQLTSTQTHQLLPLPQHIAALLDQSPLRLHRRLHIGHEEELLSEAAHSGEAAQQRPGMRHRSPLASQAVALASE